MYDSHGICDFCGEEADLTCIGDDNLCPECMKNYALCDKCQEYFSIDVTPAYYLKNGRVLCEDCAIYDLNFQGLSEDDIDHIDGLEEEEEEDEDYE